MDLSYSSGIPNDNHRRWWKDATVYHLYLASFKDSNNDGLGDLRGIISKLDYIKALGVDVIWVSPFYKSPQFDMGYDISDWNEVHAPYGTMSDMEMLICEIHERGLKVVIDLSINHTSTEHAWFEASRSSKSDPKRDWYIWRPATYDAVTGERKPPNNWQSIFRNSVWEWDEPTQEYYLHLFMSSQADLNWANPSTRQAIYDTAVKPWLARGIDGFRVDTVNTYDKADLSDAPISDPTATTQHAMAKYSNGRHMGTYLDELCSIFNEHDRDFVTIGECPWTPDKNDVLQYVSKKLNRLSMVFQFDVVEPGTSHGSKWETVRGHDYLVDFKKAVAGTQLRLQGTDGWTAMVLENHDWARSIPRFANAEPEWRVDSGKLLAMLCCTLSGTLFVFQGQEIGMVNAPQEWGMEEFLDRDAQNYWEEMKVRYADDPIGLEASAARIKAIARDNARTPMQWSGSEPFAGFSTVTPWMRVMESHTDINVANQERNPDSVLSFWKQMLRLRKEKVDLCVYGDFEDLDPSDESVFMFSKTWKENKLLVVLNFTTQTQVYRIPVSFRGAEWLSTTHGVRNTRNGGILLPFEGHVYYDH